MTEPEAAYVPLAVTRGEVPLPYGAPDADAGAEVAAPGSAEEAVPRNTVTWVLVPQPQIEIAVQDIAGVCIAQAAGADRVELCVALGETGGLTPPIGLIEAAVAIGLPVHTLIRTRPGGFTYDAVELDVLVRDVRAAVRAGAAGVVVGALTGCGDVDEDAIRALVEAADGATVTFHRAFDVVATPLTALDQLADLGVTRVLTSGGAARAIDGRVGLKVAAAHALATGGRVQIMAGGRIRTPHIGALLVTGIDAVHLSARRAVTEPGPAGPGGGTGSYDETDAGMVRAAVRAARA
ncbi:copper homeostasis protein CutC [Pengzhenrongella phosphoraccumulans]|uniref:copper homeostasis protein CutC n=1 Tax=Pengzhenrongella phosphoraccumulans TaxID=3114394 RepID=UPI00388D4C1C